MRQRRLRGDKQRGMRDSRRKGCLEARQEGNENNSYYQMRPDKVQTEKSPLDSTIWRLWETLLRAVLVMGAGVGSIRNEQKEIKWMQVENFIRV